MADAIGLERKRVRLVQYDARWPELFAAEEALIRRVLHGVRCDIEHIGSTAVPGLDAKPVLDVMLGLASLRAPMAVLTALANAGGYDHRRDDPLPDRLFFAKESHDLRTHNLSVCALGSRFWTDHLRFRDALRADAELRRAYSSLKHALAARYPNDRIAYTDGKNAFVASALADIAREVS
jgi:GrpB-like predicted nucleotidyltransferase (UPF0157 family)